MGHTRGVTSNQHGLFITFEGGEGTGKSTQIKLLAAWLEDQNHQVCLTREPGGTPGAEAIRELVLSGHVERWQPMTELLLMMAARSDHLDRKIRPALTRREIVVSDRFFDSSRVYQGIAGAVGLAAVDKMHDPLLGDDRPNLTLLLDAPPSFGLKRREQAGGGSRFEAKSSDFHEKVRQGFLQLAALEPKRFCVVDATLSIDAVHAVICTKVAELLR